MLNQINLWQIPQRKGSTKPLSKMCNSFKTFGDGLGGRRRLKVSFTFMIRRHQSSSLDGQMAIRSSYTSASLTRRKKSIDANERAARGKRQFLGQTADKVYTEDGKHRNVSNVLDYGSNDKMRCRAF